MAGHPRTNGLSDYQTTRMGYQAWGLSNNGLFDYRTMKIDYQAYYQTNGLSCIPAIGLSEWTDLMSPPIARRQGYVTNQLLAGSGSVG